MLHGKSMNINMNYPAENDMVNILFITALLLPIFGCRVAYMLQVHTDLSMHLHKVSGQDKLLHVTDETVILLHAKQPTMVRYKMYNRLPMFLVT
jgi:hypothetical protein